jgi:lysozyme family protein
MGDFKKAIEVVICLHEGGFQNRVDDPGNWRDGKLVGTKFGISAKAFPAEDIQALTIDRAEDLYEQVWGDFALINSQLVLTKVLDLAVNLQWGDKGHATEILQRAIVACGIPVAVDGVFGPRTATACNNLPPAKLLEDICAQAVLRYSLLEAANPEMKAWFANWNKRASWMPQDVVVAQTAPAQVVEEQADGA